MKKSELLKLLKKNGITFARHGTRHDIYYSPKTGKEFPIPRYAKEITKGTLHNILTDAGLKQSCVSPYPSKQTYRKVDELMAKYVFPVILTPEESGLYSANFPDLESCYTQGDDLADALDASADVLALTLYSLEEKGKAIPAPTPINDIKTADGEITSLIFADTIEYRKFYDNKAVKKTLTIPSWLNTIAERNDVNFSAVLQKALKEELSIAE